MGVLKVLMIIFNFIFWLAGLALIIIGGEMYAVLREMLGRFDSGLNIPVVIIVIGVLIFAIAFCGCFGAMNENSCMLYTFASALGIIFLMGLIVGIVGFTMKDKLNITITNTLQSEINDYNDHKNVVNFWQSTLKCCGVDGPADYNNHMSVIGGEGCGKNKGVKSCHKYDICILKLYGKGCKTKFVDFIERNVKLIAGVTIGIAFVLLFGIVFACMLVNDNKEKYEPV